MAKTLKLVHIDSGLFKVLKVSPASFVGYGVLYEQHVNFKEYYIFQSMGMHPL